MYGTKASLPAVGGSEGVGVVQEVGGDVSGVRVGDWVVPAKPGMGMFMCECACMCIKVNYCN